ncbi:phosphatase PAP2 family protein [Rhizobium sp. CAU 1783]
MPKQTHTTLIEAVHRDRDARRAVILALVLLSVWLLLLAAFHFLPALDVAMSAAFFEATACAEGAADGIVCGDFPYQRDTLFVFLRQVLFYIPSFAAVIVIVALIRALQHHGATFQPKKVRDHSIALLTLFLGPYVLVNLLLKSFSGRPRPHQTDVFGGELPFMPAGSFAGGCENNCSFISGEAAGAGWLICLIPLLPVKMRPVFGPALIAVSLVTPAFRVSFGGHYLSDVVLGWLSSPAVFAVLLAVFEIARVRKNTL